MMKTLVQVDSRKLSALAENMSIKNKMLHKPVLAMSTLIM